MNTTVRASRHALRRLTLTLASAALAGAAFTAQAGPSSRAQQAQPVRGNAITAVAARQQGTATEVRIELKAPLAALPQAFLVHTPPRVAIDLPDTANLAGSGVVQLGEGEVKSASIVQTGGRTRLVLNLHRPATHALRLEGRTLVVSLDASAQVAAAAEASMAAAYTSATSVVAQAVRAPAAAADRHVLRDVDFRRGRDGEGRVVVELSGPQAGVDVRTQGGSIVVDFLRTRLPEALRRRLDVTDFGTPVKSVRTEERGEHVRMTIEPTGAWEHNAFQSDTQFVVEVKAVKEDPSRLGANGRGYKGEKLSLNFQNIDVRALLQVIAEFTNLNIVASETVAGGITLRLKDVPWDQALDIVLQSKGLDMRRNGNVLLVAPREELATKEKLELESRQQIAEIEPLRTEVFTLNYQKADALGKLLSDEKQRVLSKRGSAVVDQRTNKLFVQDTAARLDEVRKLVQQVDIPVRQVLIEARIVEADDRFSRNLGARLGFNDLRSTVRNTIAVTDPVTGAATALNVPVFAPGYGVGGGRGLISGNLQGAADLSSQLGSNFDGTNALGLGRMTAVANTNFVNLPAAAIAGANPASFAISLFGSGLTRFLNLEISALEADQRGKVVSSPRVLTADQGKAVIEQGTELPFQTATASGATAITFRKANLKLEVVPQITPEGNVIMEVQVNRDSVGQLTPAGFAIDTRAVRTQVLVENGGTVVIGGIYEQFERNRTNKVPVLGDLPVVGNAFKNVQRTNDRTELLVFLTPRVMNDLAQAQATAR